ncbi:hypothetical protein EVG20_g10613, partial [Dentipellis fragilis]
MLGTLIFEHEESQGDCLRLLFGKLPASRTGPAEPSNDDTVPTSPHYARVLADLAHERGFDGYLLNFEYHLRAGGGVGQTRALAAWIALLTAELKAKIGPHAEVRQHHFHRAVALARPPEQLQPPILHPFNRILHKLYRDGTTPTPPSRPNICTPSPPPSATPKPHATSSQASMSGAAARSGGAPRELPRARAHHA